MRLGHRQPVLLLLAISCLLFCCDPRSEAGGTALQSSAAGTLPAADTLLAAQYFQQAKALQLAASYDSSSHLFKLSAKEYQGHGYTRRRLFANDEVAYNLWKQGLLDSSRVVLTTALTVCVDSGYASDYVEAKLLKNLGVVAKKSGNPDSALTIYKKAIDILHNDSSEVYPLEGVLWGNVGNIMYVKANYDLAIYSYDMAVQKLFEVYQDSAREDMARNLRNIGITHRTRGDYYTAAQFYRQALEIQKKIYDLNDHHLAQSYFILGTLYDDLEDFHRSLSYYDHALRILNRQISTDQVQIIEISNLVGLTLMELNSFAEAQNIFEVALTKIDSINHGNTFLAGQLHGNLGQVLAAQKMYEQAASQIHIAIKIFQSLNRNNDISIAEAYRILGSIYTETSAFEDAASYLNQAINIRTEHSAHNSTAIADLHLNLGDLWERQQYYWKASSSYHKSMEVLFGKAIDFNAVPVVDSLTGLNLAGMLKALLKKANSLAEFCWSNRLPINSEVLHLETINETNRLANILVDSLRAGYNVNESRLFLTEQYSLYHSAAVRVAFRLHQLTQRTEYLEDAFIYSEKNKARVLLSALQRKNAIQLESLPEEIRLQEDSIRQEINFYQSKIYGFEGGYDAAGAPAVEFWKEKLFTLREEHDAIIEFLENKFADYRKAKYDTKIQPVSLIQDSLLVPGETLVEYFVDLNVIYAFVITSEQFYCLRDTASFDLEESINDLRTGIIDFDFPQYTRCAHQLYELLVKNLLEISPCNSLIIVPSGELSYLPFEILLTTHSNSEDMEYKDLAYLIRKCSIRYLNSCTYRYASLVSKTTPAVSNFGGFAPVKFKNPH